MCYTLNGKFFEHVFSCVDWMVIACLLLPYFYFSLQAKVSSNSLTEQDGKNEKLVNQVEEVDLVSVLANQAVLETKKRPTGKRRNMKMHKDRKTSTLTDTSSNLRTTSYSFITHDVTKLSLTM